MNEGELGIFVRTRPISLHDARKLRDMLRDGGMAEPSIGPAMDNIADLASAQNISLWDAFDRYGQNLLKHADVDDNDAKAEN